MASRNGRVGGVAPHRSFDCPLLCHAASRRRLVSGPRLVQRIRRLCNNDSADIHPRQVVGCTGDDPLAGAASDLGGDRRRGACSVAAALARSVRRRLLVRRAQCQPGCLVLVVRSWLRNLTPEPMQGRSRTHACMQCLCRSGTRSWWRLLPRNFSAVHRTTHHLLHVTIVSLFRKLLGALTSHGVMSKSQACV